MFSRILKKAIVFDAFPKVDAECQDRSPQGGLVTIIVSICLWFLIVSEFREYWYLNQKYEFIVDQSINHKLQINVDITVNTPCNYLTVDVIDVAGEGLHMTNELQKISTTFEVRSAQPLGDDNDSQLNVRQVVMAAISKDDPFSSNNDVPVFYSINIIIFFIIQIEDTHTACRIFGYLDVNRVTGNLHITALGHGYGYYHTAVEVMNFTHRIDEFSFGIHYPRLINPLDNSVEIAEANMEAFMYFLSVVPTTYIDNNNRVLLTNQYSVTDYSRVIDLGGRGVPGIFFKYDIEPISVRIAENGMGFITFLVRLSGLVGGIWVTAGFALKIANRIWSSLQKSISDNNGSTYFQKLSRE
ncbi:endoplasmic reticulum vesicle transporter-domain-containing protein [Glomus cerebriforme]|uniref:Endoplasmic reticulum vesicle transporter-domain-containing protein n=1 Tax=Glomus cerebriforme TaxID=658196 RepID=A0A397T903_9GLOM|nr:endoplasmic reticulum vesicle transporter-domain-containing protein [Glomus cerebriforme]